jgi:hypothetical protein
MPTRVRELLTKARALNARERGELARAWVALPAVWFGLRLFPLRRLLRARWRPTAPTPASDDAVAARASARLVAAASRFSPFPSSCLSRSIVLWRLLQRRGVPAEIRIGVRPGGNPLAAHAWVEVDGEPVNDTADVAERHAVFDEELTAKV